jgi:hypothetical protein
MKKGDIVWVRKKTEDMELICSAVADVGNVYKPEEDFMMSEYIIVKPLRIFYLREPPYTPSHPLFRVESRFVFEYKKPHIVIKSIFGWGMKEYE